MNLQTNLKTDSSLTIIIDSYQQRTLTHFWIIHKVNSSLIVNLWLIVPCWVNGMSNKRVSMNWIVVLSTTSRISATLCEVTLPITDFVTNEAHHRLLLRLTRTREIKMCADWFFMHFPLDVVGSSVPNFALVNGRKWKVAWLMTYPNNSIVKMMYRSVGQCCRPLSLYRLFRTKSNVYIRSRGRPFPARLILQQNKLLPLHKKTYFPATG